MRSTALRKPLVRRLLGHAPLTQPTFHLVVGTLSHQAVDLLPGLHPGRLLGQLGSAEHLDQGTLSIGGQVPEVVLDGDPLGRLVALRVVERRLLQLAAGPRLHGPLLGRSACFFPVLDAEGVPLGRLEHLVVVGGQGGARHRGVRPFPGGTLGSHHQGDVGGHPLRLVHGQRVATVDGVVVGGVEGQLALVGSLQGERLALDVDRGDHPRVPLLTAPLRSLARQMTRSPT